MEDHALVSVPWTTAFEHALKDQGRAAGGAEHTGLRQHEPGEPERRLHRLTGDVLSGHPPSPRGSPHAGDQGLLFNRASPPRGPVDPVDPKTPWARGPLENAAPWIPEHREPVDPERPRIRRPLNPWISRDRGPAAPRPLENADPWIPGHREPVDPERPQIRRPMGVSPREPREPL